MHRMFARVMNPLCERILPLLTIVCSAILALLFLHVLRLQGPPVEWTRMVDGSLYATVGKQLHALYSGEIEQGGGFNDFQTIAFAALALFVVWMGAMGLVISKWRRNSRELENKLASQTNGVREYQQQLERERMNRQQAEENLRQTQTILNQRVNERISQLQQVNAALSQELAEQRRGGGCKEKVGAETFERAVFSEASNCDEIGLLNYSVSHDLRAPIRSINGFSQALLDDYGLQLDGRARDYVLRVREAGHRMDRLIDGLLNLAQLGHATLNLRPVDLTALSQSVREDCHQAEPGRHVDWVIMENLTATADADLLRVVIENLIGNSWKYTGKVQFPRIEFGVTYHCAQPVFYVRDNGAGFDMAGADKLFGIFQRLHDGKEFPGTGIGLATVHRIIHRHGGRVWAEAAVNHGATFFFTLEPHEGIP